MQLSIWFNEPHISKSSAFLHKQSPHPRYEKASSAKCHSLKQLYTFNYTRSSVLKGKNLSLYQEPQNCSQFSAIKHLRQLQKDKSLFLFLNGLDIKVRFFFLPHVSNTHGWSGSPCHTYRERWAARWSRMFRFMLIAQPIHVQSAWNTSDAVRFWRLSRVEFI